MNKHNFLGYLILFFILPLFSFCQVGLGQWRDHLQYTSGRQVVVAGDYVYMITNVGLVKYGKKTNEIDKISKVEGLNDSDIRSMAYNENYNCLILGYGNGNIDIIQNNQIINVNDIKRKSINSDKSINTISFSGNKAYFGCSFGIVVFDIVKKEVKETWFIGNNGSYLSVNALQVKDSFAYAATNDGVYMGNLQNNLVDFSNWDIISNNNLDNPRYRWMSGKTYNHLVCFQDKLIVNYHNPSRPSADTLLVYHNGRWGHFTNLAIHDIYSISCNDQSVIIPRYGSIDLFNSEFDNYRTIWLYNINGVETNSMATSVVFDPVQNDVLWIADKVVGMLNYNLNTWSSLYIHINGPESNNIFDLTSYGDNVYGVAGSLDLSWGPMWKPSFIYKFSNQTWKSFNHQNNPGLSVNANLISIIVNPNDPSHYFCGSWGDGLYEFRNDRFYKLYNTDNSPLRGVNNSSVVRVCGITFDEDGNLWVTNSLSAPNIHVLTPQGTWYSLDYSSLISNRLNLGKLIITKDNIKWLILPQNNGLFVFDDNGTLDNRNDDKIKRLSIIGEDGDIISNDIHSIAEDKNGYIWVGTAKGVVVYYNPENVFKSNIVARRIKIPRNDGTDNADLLLENEAVTTINVDGANKKWFGTRTGGVFYTSEDGLEQYYHFTSDNSPLLDNNILCATIAPKSGEVFFGTNMGIMSFRNLATEGSENYSDVYVFPNPVKETYEGPITITGLVAGSYVKITDISGNLVYEVKSDGGQAVWYGKDMNGQRVKTGVYLVFSTNDTGSKTDVTKILFIN